MGTTSPDELVPLMSVYTAPIPIPIPTKGHDMDLAGPLFMSVGLTIGLAVTAGIVKLRSMLE